MTELMTGSTYQHLCRSRGQRAAFMPYHAMGYPSRAATLEVVQSAGR